MTTENNSIYFEDIKVSKCRENSSFKVELDTEGYTFFIKNRLTEKISIESRDDENLIAIILAYIEYARKSRNSDKDDKVKSLEDDVLFFGLSKLLDKYSGEELIEIIRELKWHEICQVLNSEKPISEIEEFI